MNLNDKVETYGVDALHFFHKIHKHEAFLSYCICANSEYKASAFLPEHHYFCDHIKPITDLMFILECARQAETYIVHKYERQSVDTKFILTGWSCEFSESFAPVVDLQGQYITLKITTDNTRRVRDKLLSQEYKINVVLNDMYIAMIHMSVKYMTSEAYHKIRNEINNEITTREQLFFDQTLNVPPKYVFRKAGENVVIRMPKFKGDKVTSILTVNMNNTAYFDHVQDHYPAMILMEAGKQNCQLWISRFSSEKTPVLSAMKSKFFLYAEFDKEVQIIAVKVPCKQENKIMFNVLLKQGGVNIAEMAYSFKMFDM